jgi:hypothetical protein
LAPLLLWYAGLAVLLVGADSALDWHRHSGPEHAILHLHPHVGDHHHGADGHDHPGKPAPGPEESERGVSGTLSLASGALSGAPPAAPEIPGIVERRSSVDRPVVSATSADALHPWAPRGPPL